MFVRNFMSFQTPYNSLLLYHDVGTGKTCSAISISEEMRTYMKQLGITKRIIVVASPAVQKNFILQLFDERKLQLVNGLWNIKACTGNKFIKEINPMNIKGLAREKVVRQIKRIIHLSYQFFGYNQFSNYLERVMKRTSVRGDSDKKAKEKQNRALKKEFSNRMIIIDEVHNLRMIDEKSKKSSVKYLAKLAKATNNLKLLILSATPMFNSHLEIVWLLNLLNANDNRFLIEPKEIFNNEGDFIEGGKELLIQKMTGYVSYVKGNNPFTFPYIIYPKIANNPDSYKSLLEDNSWTYPTNQINGYKIENKIEKLDLVMTNLEDYQNQGYNIILDSLKKRKEFKETSKGFSYTLLEPLTQGLNMIYPHEIIKDRNDFDISDDTLDIRSKIGEGKTDSEVSKIDDEDEISKNESEKIDKDVYRELYGTRGLTRTMNYDVKTKRNFTYKKEILEKYGRIFSPDNISKYSSKISYICNSIRESKGIIFVYSQYIDGGCIPIALALEEMGVTRYGNDGSLFKDSKIEQLNAYTMKPREKNEKFSPAKYAMISGDRKLTSDVEKEIKSVTGPDNKNGERVKVIIVSKAGSEGLDFQNIRQIHILDPWFNLNRQDQIIGRGVRNLSHCQLPYEERNVMINLYGTKLREDIEAVDMYLYRLAEEKAKKIAKITRLLKENSVDCLLNKKGQNYSQDRINNSVIQRLSNKVEIDLKIGEVNNSLSCDFDLCDYDCNSRSQEILDIDISTYNEDFILMNIDNILQKVKTLFKETYFYDKISLIQAINRNKINPEDQINYALDILVKDKNEYITDMLGRLGRLVNVGEYYFYQPIELDSKNPESVYERTHPVDFKREKIIYNVKERIEDIKKTDCYKLDLEKSRIIFNKLINEYNNLRNPKKMKTDKEKQDWVRNAAWAILSLNKWNKIHKEELYKLAFDHIIDTLSYEEKINLLIFVNEILNNSINKEFQDGESKYDSIKDTFVFKSLNNFLNKFLILTESGNKIYILANFNKNENEQVTFISFHDDCWKENFKKSYNREDIFKKSVGKFKIKNKDDINDNIGFLAPYKGEGITFKMKDETIKRNTGTMCDNLSNKKIIVEKINDVLGYIKYKYPDKKIVSITNSDKKEFVDNKDIKQFDDHLVVPYNKKQFCVEMELLLRYNDEKKINNKKWFFNTVEHLYN